MQPLLEKSLPDDPLELFEQWYEVAKRSSISQPDAMTLATVGPDGRPSARIVLLKEFNLNGFVFVTNYHSRKGKEIAGSPFAALVFHWAQLERQVRIEGWVQKISAGHSDRLFAARPRENQLSSAASPQSDPIAAEELDRRFEDLSGQYVGSPVPRPEHWGGFRLVPDRVEFWQHRFARMNDRILYVQSPAESRLSNAWHRTRLAP